MINISNKDWDQLNYADIEEWLNDDFSANGQENFFFDFKSDDVNNTTLIKEVCAFANTYGGYLLIGVDDDGTIKGCRKWTEERIHTTVYDSITPIPIFDVKTFRQDIRDPLIVVKVEPGPMAPYITNRGEICERVSSGSMKITDSAKLAQLNKKNHDELLAVQQTIELPEIVSDGVPSNVFAYLDTGILLECSNKQEIRKRWDDIRNSGVIEFLRRTQNDYSVSKIGDAYCISIGKAETKDNFGNSIPLNAGINNFIEISRDGNVRSRILFTGHVEEKIVNLIMTTSISMAYEHIYRLLFGNIVSESFLYARKYEKLNVLKQFSPAYQYDTDEKIGHILNSQLEEHYQTYGNNIIIEGNRIPRNGYSIIDKRVIDSMGFEEPEKEIIGTLFYSWYFNLGFIDRPKGLDDYV